MRVSVHDGFNASYVASTAPDDTIGVTITVTAAPVVVRRPPTDGGGGGGGGGSGSGGVTVVEPDPPGFTEGSSTTRSLPASARPGDAVGKPVVATHPNNFSFTYSLSGTDSAKFTVDESTGQIRLGQVVSLEEGDRYTVTLGATASLGERSTLTVGTEVSIRVTEPEPLAIRYDFNRNGTIELDEVLAVIADYLAGIIEKDEVLAVVALYFAA